MTKKIQCHWSLVIGHCDCDGDSDGGGDDVCGDYAPLNIAGCLGTQRALHQ